MPVLLGRGAPIGFWLSLVRYFSNIRAIELLDHDAMAASIREVFWQIRTKQLSLYQQRLSGAI